MSGFLLLLVLGGILAAGLILFRSGPKVDDCRLAEVERFPDKWPKIGRSDWDIDTLGSWALTRADISRLGNLAYCGYAEGKRFSFLTSAFLDGRRDFVSSGKSPRPIKLGTKEVKGKQLGYRSYATLRLDDSTFGSLSVYTTKPLAGRVIAVEFRCPVSLRKCGRINRGGIAKLDRGGDLIVEKKES